MEQIKLLSEVDYIQAILTIFVILFGVKEIIEIIGYFRKHFRIKTGQEQDKETVENRISKLEKHDKWQYTEISKISLGIQDIQKRMDNIQSQLTEKEINDMRWEILDMASAISSGRKYSKEQFDHVIQIFEDYEKILEKNGLTNGRVSASMEVIDEMYRYKLKHGFD